MKLYANDEQVATLVAQEQERQATTLSLIASENYVDQDVLAIGGSILTNKYAEGYPGKRYYAGCRIGDQLELLAQERCKKLFNAEHVNVQPHAGSQANAAAYFALLQPGDTILGMSLAEGGHLTHGHKINFSGILYNAVQYTVDPHTHMLDYDAIEKIALDCKPKMIIAGASAYCRIIDFERFGAIAKKVGAYLLADIAHIAGLIAVGLHPNPFPHADVVTSTTHKTLRGPRGGLIMCKKEFAQAIDRAVFPCLQGGPLMHVIAAKAVAFKQALQPEFVEYQQRVIANAQALAQALQKLGYTIITGGTDNHLFIVDLSDKGLTGKDAEVALEMAGIMVSRSCIPFDKQKPALTSGIRLGTPAITTRGMCPDQMSELASLIDRVINNYQDHKTLQAVAQEVAQLCCLYTLATVSVHEKQECNRF